jgi:tRNA A37 threonylcarbamoyladenosine modification protein TsaB
MRQSSAEDGRRRLVLALEASSRTYAVAVGDGEDPRAQAAARRDDPSFRGLSELVTRTLDRAGENFGDIGTIGVDVGPGGLLSVRAVVAYANGLAFALGAKVFPISSLELMAVAAQQSHRDPILCLKRGLGGNTYAGLFADGEMADMRHGPPDSVVPAIAGGLARVCVAGAARDDVVGLLPGVFAEDSMIDEADVVDLYRTARAAAADPERLVSAASPLNEASRIFHEPGARRHLQRP